MNTILVLLVCLFCLLSAVSSHSLASSPVLPDFVTTVFNNECDADLTALLSPNTSLIVSERAQLAFSLAQCHWQTMDRPWVQICDESVHHCLATLPDIALVDWILHWTLVSKAERHVKSNLRQFNARVMSIDGERLSLEIFQGQEHLALKISALVDGADQLRVKHGQFAEQFSEFVTRLMPLRVVVQSLTRAVTHVGRLIDTLAAHHSRLSYLFWLMRTVLLTRVMRIPFVKLASCLGEHYRQVFSHVTDGVLCVQLFVLRPLLSVDLSLASMLLVNVAALVLVYLRLGVQHREHTKSGKSDVEHQVVPDWSRAKLSLYRQLSKCADWRAREEMRRKWTNEQRAIIRHLPGRVSSEVRFN